MAMGIVSDDDFKKEVNKTKSIPGPKVEFLHEEESPAELPSHTEFKERGRGKGNVEVPDSLRKLIGETSVIEGRQAALDLAQDFGIKPSSVSAYRNGSTSTSSYGEQPNLEYLNQARERISKKARQKLILAINQITEEKLSNAKVKEASSVARDMALVIKNLEPEPVRNPFTGGPTFVFYSPHQKREEEFEVIDVQSKED